jgi:hypothetical protein
MSESNTRPSPPNPAAPPEPPDIDRELAEMLAEFADVTNPHQRAFLAAFIVGKGIRSAQRLSGVHSKSHYGWLETDSLYRERFDLARRMLADVAEEEAYRRAFLGYETSVSWRGEIRTVYKSYSDALAIFLLKGMKSDVYGRYAPDPNAGGVSAIEITIRKEGEETKEAAALPQITIPYEEPEE